MQIKKKVLVLRNICRNFEKKKERNIRKNFAEILKIFEKIFKKLG